MGRFAATGLAGHAAPLVGRVARLAAPFAVIGIHTSGGALVRLEYLPPGAATLAPGDALTRQVCEQIRAYLDDPTFQFNLPLALQGTEHQHRVWTRIQAIPPGLTRAYGAVARDCQSSARAVGTACGRNPLPLVIPCHRVVASAGIGGFMGSGSGPGIVVKRWLLAHEGVRL